MKLAVTMLAHALDWCASWCTRGASALYRVRDRRAALARLRVGSPIHRDR